MGSFPPSGPTGAGDVDWFDVVDGDAVLVELKVDAVELSRDRVVDVVVLVVDDGAGVVVKVEFVVDASTVSVVVPLVNDVDVVVSFVG